MIPVIREIVEKICDLWNIRLAVIFSLFLQTLLIILVPSRKHSSSKMLALIIWSAYLLADATALYAVGLISHDQCRDSSGDDLDLLAFWSPFLIVHLGGPDTITTLALEDNELWLRHFLTLVIQAAATLYVFLQSLPENKLMIPMILMFLSGCIKYLERTRSLYLACNERSLGDWQELSLADNRQFDGLQLVPTAYRLFRSTRSFERLSVEPLFHRIKATIALGITEVELNFIYEALFTKTMVVHTSMGFFFRFFSFCCLITSLMVFRFHITKHGVFNGINVAVTYVLFLGAVALEVIAFLMAVLSDWTVATMINSKEHPNQNWWRRIVARVFDFVKPAFVQIWSYWTPPWYQEKDKKCDEVEDEDEDEDEEGAQPKDQELRMPLLFRRWSGCLSGHNLIRYCLKGQRNSGVPIVKAICYAQLDRLIDWVGLRDLWDEMTCLSREPLRKNLWELIFKQLKAKFIESVDAPSSSIPRIARQIASAKGEWVLQHSDLNGELRINLKRFIGFPSYDKSLVWWHVATELLYNDDQDPAHIFSENNAGHRIRVGTNSDVDPEGYVEMSKTLSDYMLYLLIMQPNIMAPVGGKTMFEDTCAAAKELFDEMNWGPSQQVEACKCILEGPGFHGQHWVKLFIPRVLATELRKLKSKKWEFISQVWVELLCHAAVHSSGKAHKQQLRKGGELITFVWLLMFHLGFRMDKSSNKFG